MESLVTLALTGTKCIKNRQKDKHSSLYTNNHAEIEVYAYLTKRDKDGNVVYQ
jgi:hypothetical protein